MCSSISNMNTLKLKLKGLFKNEFIKRGMPLFVLVLGGSIYLEQFTKLKYKYGKQSSLVDREELKNAGLDIRDPSEVTLEAIYDRYKQEENIDDWKQVRIPRPWEENDPEENKT